MYRILGSAAPAALALVLAAPAAAVAASPAEYSMNLSKSTATMRAGGATVNLITFQAEPRDETTRVTLSATGLPSGVTAHFIPPKPQLAGSSVLILTSLPSAPAASATITVTAITISSDPIGTSAAFGLTVTGG